jgi:hypothetical protein
MTVSLAKDPIAANEAAAPRICREALELMALNGYTKPECRPTDIFRDHFELSSGAIKHTNAPIVR